jgi:hypothetical protein
VVFCCWQLPEPSGCIGHRSFAGFARWLPRTAGAPLRVGLLKVLCAAIAGKRQRLGPLPNIFPTICQVLILTRNAVRQSPALRSVSCKFYERSKHVLRFDARGLTRWSSQGSSGDEHRKLRVPSARNALVLWQWQGDGGSGAVRDLHGRVDRPTRKAPLHGVALDSNLTSPGLILKSPGRRPRRTLPITVARRSFGPGADEGLAE